MAGNTFGQLLKITTFGESHGAGLGVIIDGCPAGLQISETAIQHDLDRRKPGYKADGTLDPSATARTEDDKAEILSGVFNGISEGTPISILIRNTTQRSLDYNRIKNTFRPGHADYTYFEKYGIRDYRGGGRSSGRETAARVAAGAVAKIILSALIKNIQITAFTRKAAGISCDTISLKEIEKNSMRAADAKAAVKMNEKISDYRKQGNSCGGIVECIVHCPPTGLGEPVFNKLDGILAHAMLSIGAVKGIEFGSGFEAAELTGSTNNDFMKLNSMGVVSFETNHAGGILGGISTGNDIIFRVAVKPVPSIFLKQRTIAVNKKGFYNTDIEIEGRHDICLCPRIVPVVEAMTALVLADAVLLQRSSKI